MYANIGNQREHTGTKTLTTWMKEKVQGTRGIYQTRHQTMIYEIPEKKMERLLNLMPSDINDLRGVKRETPSELDKWLRMEATETQDGRLCDANPKTSLPTTSHSIRLDKCKFRFPNCID